MGAKRFITSAVALIAATSTSTQAQSSDWIEIGSGGITKLSIDPGTIKLVSGSIRSAWFQFRKNGLKDKTFTKEFDRVDCDNESVATVSIVKYAVDGTVTYSKTTPTVLIQYEPAPPGTFAATMVRVVCGFDLSTK